MDVAPLRFVNDPRLSAVEVAAAVLFQIQPQTQDFSYQKAKNCVG